MTDREPPAIHIPQEVVDAAAVPDDLDSSILGDYEFPTPRRRRASAWVYLGGGLLAVAGAVAGLPSGMWAVAGGFLLLAIWNFAAAWPLNTTDGQAMAAAARAVGFTVGHSSGALRFEGWRARPVWSILLYSADDPPSRRGLVLVDGVNGELRGDVYEETLPTDSG